MKENMSTKKADHHQMPVSIFPKQALFITEFLKKKYTPRVICISSNTENLKKNTLSNTKRDFQYHIENDLSVQLPFAYVHKLEPR